MTRVVFLLALLGAAPAAANLRAPGQVPHAPSTALYPAAGLEVRAEKLAFRCADRSCAVEAEYLAHAEAEAELAFEFILPVDAAISVRIGGTPVPAEATSALPLGEADAKLNLQDSGRDGETPLYRARFRTRVIPGLNQLVISYTQPMGAHERDYGYTKNGRWVDVLQYELWPLKEWKRAPDFRIELTVTMPREAPGWWARNFGTVRSITCYGGDGPLPGAKRAQDGGELVYRARLGHDFPDRLRCHFADEDLL